MRRFGLNILMIFCFGILLLSACKRDEGESKEKNKVTQEISAETPKESESIVEERELPKEDEQILEEEELVKERTDEEMTENSLKKEGDKEQFLGIRKVVMQSDGSAIITASLSEMIVDTNETNDYRIEGGEIVKLRCPAQLMVDYPIEEGLPRLKPIPLRDFAIKANARIHDLELEEDYYQATIRDGAVTSLMHQYLP